MQHNGLNLMQLAAAADSWTTGFIVGVAAAEATGGLSH